MFHRERLKTLITYKALQFGDFTLASGEKSNFYLDLSKIALDPEGLFLICKCFWEIIDYDNFDSIAGPALGACPMVCAMVVQSYLMGNPYKGLIVRSEVKDHGDGNLIEGPVIKGMRTVMVDDVVSSGASVKKAIEVLRKVGCNPQLIISIVDRGDSKFDEDIIYRTLFNLKDLGISKNTHPRCFSM